MDHVDSFADLRVIIVMGVAASGKTTVGQALATSLGWRFYDADDFHSESNKAKMHAGIPLDDADRAPWLSALRVLVGRLIQSGECATLACSALKEQYRQALVPDHATDAVRFVYLEVPRAILEARLEKRKHFFPPSLLDSQLATLEPPHDAVRVDGSLPIPEIITRIRRDLSI